MKHFLLAAFVLAFTFQGSAQTEKKDPSFEEVISLRSVGAVVMSPNGELVAFTQQSSDWDDNRFDTEIWLMRNGSEPFQVTNNPNNSSFAPAFSPDGKWMAFLADKGNKTQVYAFRMNGGESVSITEEEEGVSAFQWHPDGKRIVFAKREKDDPSKKQIEKRYGAFSLDDRDYSLTHIWEIAFDPNMPNPSELPCYETADSLKTASGCITRPQPKRLTEGNFNVNGFKVSPDGKMIAFNHQPNPLINSSSKSDISVLDLEKLETLLLVNNPSSDRLEDWSPDSKQLLYSSYVDDSVSNFYTNSKIFIIDLGSKNSRQIAAKLDENPSGLTWTPKGIYGLFWQKTQRHIYRIEPKDGSFFVMKGFPDMVTGVSFSQTGDKLAVNARNGNQLNEIWVSNVQKPAPKKVTDLTKQIAGWKVSQSEVVVWRSKDGALIEGVLHKPVDYDPTKKYPLMVVIHGGPTGIDTPSPVPGYVYPIVQWLNKGCLVLQPNYRGSAGYGEAFRSLNVKNLGVGDAWDVLSGVDNLSASNLIDTTRMGVMGWSQGGYISAFLTTNTDRFKAVSVGAGISNWMTYYVNTDIHPFTIQYLKANPWDNEEIYRKTSPMTNIKNAKTPTLIQHGEFDQRVPIPNAYELLQGLRDQNVPAELVVYKGFGHGITKPKERLAATWHNWQWFAKYVWGEEIELPTGEGK
jgi:dipeptidyl aminopeptidase/acylaminoacyl peptidase